MRWIPGKDGTLEALAVGSIDGRERREVVATMHPDGKPEFAGTQVANQIADEVQGATNGEPLPAQGGPAEAQITNGQVEDFLKAKYSSAT